MTRKRGITEKQKQAIKTYVSKGYSANKIQKKLQQRHMGMRRQRLLRYNRIYRRKAPQYPTQKYTRYKYRAPKIGFLGKQLAVYGSEHGKSKRIQMSGSGYQLYQAMLRVSRHPPKKQFLTISAEALLDDPSRYLERGNWDAHPEASS